VKDLITLLMLPVLLVLVVGHLGTRRRRAWARALTHAAEPYGLAVVPDVPPGTKKRGAEHGVHAHAVGQVDGMDVRIGLIHAPHGARQEATVRLSARPAGLPTEIFMRSAGLRDLLVTDYPRLGDPAFDQAVRIEGDLEALRWLLDAPTRAALVAACARGITLEQGEVRWNLLGRELRGPRLRQMAAAVIDVARTLHARGDEASAAEKGSESGGLPRLSAAEADLAARSLCFATAHSEATCLVDILHHDPLPAVRAGALARLATAFWAEPTAQLQALLAQDTQPDMVRARALTLLAQHDPALGLAHAHDHVGQDTALGAAARALLEPQVAGGLAVVQAGAEGGLSLEKPHSFQGDG
jgi:hypothetical protein